jgi:hypothetical protein
VVARLNIDPLPVVSKRSSNCGVVRFVFLEDFGIGRIVTALKLWQHTRSDHAVAPITQMAAGEDTGGAGS